MEDYGQIENIQRVLQVRRKGKSCVETYCVGDIVAVNYRELKSTGYLGDTYEDKGCTGRISRIESGKDGYTVLTIDCSTLYKSRVVKVIGNNMVSIGRASKGDVKCMQEEGDKYLCV